MTKFVAGFCFAIVSMFAWAAYSDPATLPKAVTDYIAVPGLEQFMIVGGYDDKKEGHILHVEPDGSVICKTK